MNAHVQGVQNAYKPPKRSPSEFGKGQRLFEMRIGMEGGGNTQSIRLVMPGFGRGRISGL
jgi:hypothetical protein